MNQLKTIRARDIADVNSTLFLRCRGKWKEIHHLRRGSFLTDWSGMMHAAAAVRRRPAWSDAFVRSRVGKIWGFLPSQLSLHPLSRASWVRERVMMRRRFFTELPCPPLVDVPGLTVRPGPMPIGEKLSVAFFIKDQAPAMTSEDAARLSKFKPSIGQVRRSYGYRKGKARQLGPFNASLSWRPDVALRYRRRARETHCIVDDVLSWEEVRGVNLLKTVTVLEG